MLSLYRAVMDSDYNPLRSLPPAQRFQLMAFLSLMWTTIFCAAAGTWFWYGELIVVHPPPGAEDMHASRPGALPGGLSQRCTSPGTDRKLVEGS